jgi:predicted amidophosphoribosyltransferase
MVLKYCQFVIDLLYPKICIFCNKEITEHNSLCGDCFKNLSLISAPYCQKCGAPFAASIYQDFGCRNCAGKVLHFKRAYALYRYEGLRKELISDFKFKNQTHYAGFFSNKLYAMFKEVIADTDFIVPVPLYKPSCKNAASIKPPCLLKNLLG